jgi:hypothetical protein
MASKWGPDLLLCMPNKINFILLVSLMSDGKSTDRAADRQQTANERVAVSVKILRMCHKVDVVDRLER